MTYWKWLIHWLSQPSALWLLFAVNLIGTVYGYFWYKNQLLSTPVYLWPFVPDSPTASLFFTLVLGAFLAGKTWRYVEAFSAVTLVKYGIWASVMIISTAVLGGTLNWQHYMLLVSHLGMALQALLYIPHFSFGLRHLVLIAMWTLSNDIMDYTLGIFPWLDARLHPYLDFVYLFTVSLSLICLLIFYFGVVRNRRQKVSTRI